MKISEVYQEIKRLDNSKFIDSLKFHDINFWPLLRFNFLLAFKDNKRYFLGKPKNLDSNLKFFDKLKLKRKVFQERKRYESQLAQAIFIDESKYNTDVIDNQKYNRHIQPYYELIDSKINSKLITFDDELSNKSKTLYFNPWFFYELKKKKYSIDLSILKDEGVKINYEIFEYQIQQIILWENYFLDLFKNKKPRVVFFPCFYTPFLFGLIAACKKYGIITVDIQHGKQGKFHPIYYGWEYIPENGFEIMPDYIWTWGEYFENIILEGTNNYKYPKIIRGGNAWLMKEKELATNFIIPEKYIHTKNRKAVLVAVQPVESEFTIEFIKKAANSNQKIIWLIRFHPVMQKDREVYEKELSGLENVDLKTGNEMKLVELFSFCQAVISPWSTVVLEGIEFGMQSYIMHPTGKTIFEDDINSGLLGYCDKSEEIAEIILNNNKKVKGVIEADKSSITNSLNALLSQ